MSRPYLLKSQPTYPTIIMQGIINKIKSAMDSYRPSLLKPHTDQYNLLHFLLLMILTSLSSSQLVGQTSTWNGSVSSDWFDADNWTPIGIPTTSNDVVVPMSPIDPIIAGEGLAKSVIIDEGATLTVQDGIGVNLFIINSANNGIEVNGSFINDGLVIFEVNPSFPVQGDGIEVSGVLHNMSNGQIFINNVGGNGIHLVSTDASLTNDGFIIMGNSSAIDVNGIESMGSITNNNLIDIDRVGANGIQLVTFNASLTNDGIIVMGNSSAIGVNGIESRGNIVNNGTLSITQSANHGLFIDSGTFINNDNLSVQGDVNGIRNLGIFTNESDVFVINDANILFANLMGVFTNRGRVIAGDNVTTVGLGMLNRASVDNFNTIDIGRTDTGIRNEQSGTITNRTDGRIIVNDASVDALRNSNNASIINESCTQIELIGRLNNTSSSTITNDGYIILDSPVSHVPGNLINNGLIEDEQGTLSLSGLTNNGAIIAQPVQTTSCTTVSNAVDGSLNGFSIEVYLDQALTMQDGTYDPVTNTYTVSTELNSSLQTRYIHFTDMNNQCAYIVAWDIDVMNCDCAARCFSSTAICWNSNNQVDNSWSNPNNWMPIGVPQQGDHVIIPTDTGCNNAIVEYDHTNTDTIHRLDIERDAQLTIPTGRELPIMNVPGSGRAFRTMLIINGSLINEGALTVTNGELNGIFNFGTIDNHGDILVDGWGIDPAFDGFDGYRNFSGGALNNHTGSSLVLKNPKHTGDGMLLLGGSSIINYPSAIIEISNTTGVGLQIQSGGFIENKLDGQITIFDIMSPSDKVDIQLGAEVIWNGVVDVD